MRTKLIISSILITFFMLTAGKLMAQVDDTLPPWFKNPIEIMTSEKLFARDILFSIAPQSKAQIKSASPQILKKYKLPKGVRRVPTPFVLQYKGNCYQLGCMKGKGCDDCAMFWLDKNRDGKVQPRKEIRCICKQGKPCKVRARKVPCKKG
ncbi:MAG: hypothetical protein AAFY71_05890 [Bacteroidota bacterium]